MQRVTFTICVLSLAMAVLSQAAHGQCEYEVTAVIQAPPCPVTGPPATFATGMNESGTVVGWYQDCVTCCNDHAFVWTPDDGFQTLPKNNDVFSIEAYDINDNGTIVGTVSLKDVGFRGFVFDPETEEYVVLSPVVPNSGWSFAVAINDAGVVAGERSIGPSITPRTAFIWTADDGFTDFGLTPGKSTNASDITNNGTMVGGIGPFLSEIGFTFDGSNVNTLGPIPGGFTSSPSAANESLEIAGGGLVDVPDMEYPQAVPFVWDDGQFTLLDQLPGRTSLPRAMNDFTVLTGKATAFDNVNDQHAVLWVNEDPYDLNDVTNTSKLTTLKRGVAVNNAGQITAVGAANGDTVAFILSPVDVPIADVTGDCKTGVDDLIAVINFWGQTSSVADINESGIVDVGDLLMVLAHWGETS